MQAANALIRLSSAKAQPWVILVVLERKKERKTYNHMVSSVRDLMMIYIDGECHENIRAFKLYSEQDIVTRKRYSKR